jgi:hypothetical protein
LETTANNKGNGAEPRRPKKDRPRALRKTSKAEALAQLAERPDLAANVSAAARLWGVSRSTARAWLAEYAAMAASSPDPATAMAEPPPAPASPVAVAMVKPSHNEPFQAEPSLRDEQRPPGESASAAMAEPVDTPSPAMATTMAEPAPLMEKSAVVPATKVEWFAWRIMAPAEHPAKRDWITLLTALASATVSAGFSIYGLTSIFVGAFWPVIALGLVLECDKLRAVALIGMGRGSWRVRAGLIVVVAILMGLNGIGAYGFLAKAHLAATEKARAATEGAKQATEAANKATAASLADINGRIEVATTTLANIDKQLGQIDGAINKAVEKGRTNAAMALANDTRNTRTNLEVARAAAGRVLTDLTIEKAKIDPSPAKKDEKAKIESSPDKEVETELGPVRYLAILLGADSDTALRWFMLVVACLLDPVGVLLLLAATRAGPL